MIHSSGSEAPPATGATSTLFTYHSAPEPDALARTYAFGEASDAVCSPSSVNVNVSAVDHDKPSSECSTSTVSNGGGDVEDIRCTLTSTERDENAEKSAKSPPTRPPPTFWFASRVTTGPSDTCRASKSIVVVTDVLRSGQRRSVPVAVRRRRGLRSGLRVRNRRRREQALLRRARRLQLDAEQAGVLEQR